MLLCFSIVKLEPHDMLYWSCGLARSAGKLFASVSSRKHLLVVEGAFVLEVVHGVHTGSARCAAQWMALLATVL